MEIVISYDKNNQIFQFELYSFSSSLKLSNDCWKDKIPYFVDAKDIDLKFSEVALSQPCLGGRFEVWESLGGEGRGCLMTLPLPISPTPKNFHEVSPVIQQVPLKILVLEDNPICQRFVLKYIEECGRKNGVKHEVEACFNGLLAYKKLEEEKFDPDLVISDFDMPKWNGEKFAVESKRNGLIKKDWCVIYLLTGATFPKEKLIEFQEKNYFEKICPKPVRIENVRQMITSSSRKKSSMINFQIFKKDVEESSNIKIVNEEQQQEQQQLRCDDEEIENLSFQYIFKELVKSMSLRYEDRYMILVPFLGFFLLLDFKTFLIAVFVVLFVMVVLEPLTIIVFIKPFFSRCKSFFPIKKDRLNMETITSELLRRIEFCFLLTLEIRKLYAVSLADSYRKLKISDHSSFIFSSCLFLILIGLEILFLFFVPHGFKPLITIPLLGVSPLFFADMYVIIKGFFIIVDILQQYDDMDKKKRESLKNLVIEENHFKGVIKYTSESIARPFFLLEHYSKLLFCTFSTTIPSQHQHHQTLMDLFCFELFSISRKGIELPEYFLKKELNLNFSGLFQNLSIFKKDTMNLMLLSNEDSFEPIGGMGKHGQSVNNNIFIPIKKVLKEIIFEITKEFKKEIIFDIAIEEEVEEDYVTNDINPYCLEIILSNMIHNAIQSCSLMLKKNKKIRIGVKINNIKNSTSDIIISVLDNGIGMKKEDQKNHCRRTNNTKTTAPTYDIITTTKENRINRNSTNEKKQIPLRRIKRRKLSICESNSTELFKERTILSGEETGNPKLGIGLLCCRFIISQYMNKQQPNLQILSSKENGGGCEIIFSCSFSISQVIKNRVNDDDRDIISKRLKVFLFLEEKDVRYTKEILLSLGISKSNICVKTEEEEEEEIYFEKDNDENNSICVIFDQKIMDQKKFVKSRVESRKKKRGGGRDCFLVCVKKESCFDSKGVLRKIEDSEINFLECLHPIRKFDVMRILDFFLLLS